MIQRKEKVKTTDLFEFEFLIYQRKIWLAKGMVRKFVINIKSMPLNIYMIYIYDDDKYENHVGRYDR